MTIRLRLHYFTAACFVAASLGCGQPASESPSSSNARIAEPSVQSQSNARVMDDISSLLPGSSTRDDPSADGWDTESLSTQAGAQLKRLFSAVIETQAMISTESDISPLLSQRCSCSEIRPRDLKKVFSDGATIVQRTASKASTENRLIAEGVEGFVVEVDRLRALFRDATTARKKIKVVRISSEGDTATTRALLEVVGRFPDRCLQVNATLNCKWEVRNASDLRLAELAVVDYEEVVSNNAESVQFHEITPSVLADVEAYQDEFLVSSDVWAQRVEKEMGSDFMGYHGVSVADVNGDGLDDVYLCQAGGLANRLLLQKPDGSVRDYSVASGLDLLDSSRSALFLDFDNDGDQDVVVSTASGVVFFENTGDTKFEFRYKAPMTKQAYSLAAADFDQDGYLDVYACLYHAPPDAEVGNPMPYHDARNGSPNVLVSHLGGWRFEDVTEKVGLSDGNDRWSYAASWEDYDNDGDVDLYVANDFGRNNLYRNDEGHFSDVAAEAGVEDVASGMSVAWGDYDRDGKMDLYVSNMYSSAGGRVTYQRKFNPSALGNTRSDLQRLARGNSLFRNLGDGSFEDVSLETGVNMARWAWSSGFADINNDGFEDLVVSNGNYTGEDTGDL